MQTVDVSDLFVFIGKLYVTTEVLQAQLAEAAARITELTPKPEPKKEGVPSQ